MKQPKIIPVLLVCCLFLVGIAGYSIVDTLFSGYDPERYITLPDYKGVTIDNPVSDPTDDEILLAMDQVIAQFGTTETVTDAIQTGDAVTLDYTGTIDGQAVSAFEGSDSTVTVGQDDFLVNGIDPYLTGQKTGDTVTADLTVQEDYHVLDYAGETVTFTFTVTKVERTTIPELNDAFAQQLGYDTVEQFRTAFYDKFKEERAAENEATLRNTLWQTVVDDTVVDSYPQKELNQLVEEFIADVQAGADEYEMELLDYASFMYGTTDEESFQEYALTRSETILKHQMVLKAIAGRERIKVTDEIYNQRLAEYLALYQEEGYTEETLWEIFGGKEGLEEQFLMEEVTDVIQEYATIG